jgi:hypothetical protein
VKIVRQCRSQQPVVRFGANINQVRHTFRHVDRLGLDRNEVSDAIRADLARREPVPAGRLVAGYTTVRGMRLEYRAFRVSEGTINVGRITRP